MQFTGFSRTQDPLAGAVRGLSQRSWRRPGLLVGLALLAVASRWAPTEVQEVLRWSGIATFGVISALMFLIFGLTLGKMEADARRMLLPVVIYPVLIVVGIVVLGLGVAVGLAGFLMVGWQLVRRPTPVRWDQVLFAAAAFVGAFTPVEMPLPFAILAPIAVVAAAMSRERAVARLRRLPRRIHYLQSLPDGCPPSG